MKLIKTKTKAVKGSQGLLLMLICGWLFSLPVAVSFAQPDIRGTYVGSGTETLENCQDPADNVTFDFSITVDITDQVEGAFSGSAVATAMIGGIDVEITLAGFSGTVTEEGQISGAFTYTTLVNGVFDSSGSGTFTGQVIDNTMVVDFLGQDEVGDTCTFTGSFTANRQAT